MIQFSTCERRRALGYLQKLCPEAELTDTKDSASDLLDIIQADEVRVTDPDFHRGEVVKSKNWKEDTAERVRVALVKAKIVHTET